MTELHSNGNYEAYLAQLFNPAAGGAQFNPGAFGGGVGAGYGGLPNANANMAASLQNPWAAQNLSQSNGLWPQQQQQQMQNPAQALAAVQIAQQIAARQAVQAIQCAQALQQIVQHLVTQQWTQQAIGSQAQFGQGLGGVFGAGQIGQGGLQNYGWGTQQNAINQALQQLAQYLATQQQGQFRYGLAA
jgi:hypothetical protein